MSRTLNEDAFVAMCQVAQEKYAYLDRMQEWEKKSGLSRLFTKPRDPFPGLQEYEMGNLLTDALHGSFPELCGYKGSRERPDKYRCNLLVYSRKDAPLSIAYDVVITDKYKVHQEEHAYKKGYGFVDTGYSEQGTREQVARNRDVVYSRRQDGRAFLGEDMEPYFKRLDYFRNSVARQIDSLPKYSRSELRATLRSVMEYRAEVKEERRAESVRKPVKVDAVVSLDGFIDARMRMAKIAYDVSRGNVENTPGIREEFKFLEEAGKRFLGKESDRPDVTFAGEEIASRKRRNTGFGKDEAEALRISLKDYVKDGANRVYTYATIARDHGMAAEEILEGIHEISGIYGDEACRIAVKAIRDVDHSSVEALKGAVRESFYRNDRRILHDSYVPSEMGRRDFGFYMDRLKTRAMSGGKEPSSERSETKEEARGESVREVPSVRKEANNKKSGGLKL